MKRKDYKSNFEYQVHKVLRSRVAYEPKRVPYVIRKNYTPDFIGTAPSGREVWFESKGYFRPGDIQKYKEIISQYPEVDFVFIFMNPNNRMPGSKVRKDGSRASMRSWADDNGYMWCTYKEANKYVR